MQTIKVTRNAIRNAASTLAYLWARHESFSDRAGVERLILSHPVSVRPALCVNIHAQLIARHEPEMAQEFEALLMDLADVAEDH